MIVLTTTTNTNDTTNNKNITNNDRSNDICIYTYICVCVCAFDKQCAKDMRYTLYLLVYIYMSNTCIYVHIYIIMVNINWRSSKSVRQPPMDVLQGYDPQALPMADVWHGGLATS